MIRVMLCFALLFNVAHADPAAWHLVADDGKELWLLGSVHYLSDRDYPLPAIVNDLYTQANAIVLETDLDDIDAQQQQSTFLSAALLPSGKTLSDVLDGGTYRRAESHAIKLGIELTMLDKFEPWLIAITLTDLGMRQHGYRPELGIEQQLIAMARADGKEVHGLESLNSQIAIFDTLSTAEQQSLLDQALQELDSASIGMAELVDAWRDGELERLHEALMTEFNDFPGLYDALITNRNMNWLASIDRFLEHGTRYLVVVGALHLVGEHSVIELLEARGYTLTAID